MLRLVSTGIVGVPSVPTPPHDFERHRPIYHLTPEYGHNNDPNGLFYDPLHGRYHVFVQWHEKVIPPPGKSAWYHFVSRDLVRWERLGVDPAHNVSGCSGGATLALVGKALRANGVGFVTLQGKAALKTAQHTFSTDPACRAFLLHAGSAAAGLTLVAARTVIVVEPLVNPAIELQAVGRVHRIGQTKPTKVVKLCVAGTVDERVASLCERRVAAHRGEGAAGSSSSSSSGVDVNAADKALENFSVADMKVIFDI